GLGWETFLSTPTGKGGFFYDASVDPDFKHMHISSEDCPRISREFLKKERGRLPKVEYAQEYKGEFTDEYNQFFPTALIKSRMKNFIRWSFKENYQRGALFL
ncbi:hypothetical protein LCGC14_2196570, partial [marine sediment metagenome]